MPSKHRRTESSSAGVGLQLILFALLCVLCGAGVVAYALHSRQQSFQRDTTTNLTLSTDRHQLSEVQRRPHLLFRSTALGPSYGRISIVSLDALNGTRFVTDLPCERVCGTLGGGICLQAFRGVLTTYRAASFDRNFQTLHTFNLPGTPSRTRVSRDGRMAATTVFVNGDSYNSGGFSTRTTLINLSTAQTVGDLEEFTVIKDDQPFRKADFNFWGVTFAPDGERFFATLGTGSIMYLVEGRTSGRDLRVVREGVECPSVSPDGKRLVFKSRTYESGRMVWKLRVLNMDTSAETLVQEDRSVDDQAEWLDPDHVLYSLPRNVIGSAASDIWVANADGTGRPRLFLSEAFSPSVVRP